MTYKYYCHDIIPNVFENTHYLMIIFFEVISDVYS